MAYLRQLGSGKWQATVRHPALPKDRNRITKTFTLRRQAKVWGQQMEADFARGQTRDPRVGQLPVADWFARWFPAHRLSPTSRRTVGSAWRAHCEPKWGRWPVAGITRIEAQGWVSDLEATPRRHPLRRAADADADDQHLSPSAINNIVAVMRSLCQAAMDESPPIIISNPFARLRMPTVPPSKIVWYTRQEHAAIMAAARELEIGLRWETMIDLAAHVGLRYGEMVGLPIRDVNWLREEINVAQVWTVAGLRPYPKTRGSRRTVPVPHRIMAGLQELAGDRAPDQLLFGDDLLWHNDWHRRWYAAVERAGVPVWPPHALRHTAASWLVMDGVSLYRVQALLGHERYRTTEGYAHLAPGANDEIRDAWKRGDAPPTSTANVIDLGRARNRR